MNTLFLQNIFLYMTLDISRTASYEITLVHLVHPFSRSPQILLKIGSIVFSYIVHNNSWPWYLVTDEAGLNLGHKWAKIGPESRFFTIISSLVHQISLKLHVMIAHKSHKKKFWRPNFGQNGPKLDLKLGFCHSFKFGSLVFL